MVENKVDIEVDMVENKVDIQRLKYICLEGGGCGLGYNECNGSGILSISTNIANIFHHKVIGTVILKHLFLNI